MSDSRVSESKSEETRCELPGGNSAGSPDSVEASGSPDHSDPSEIIDYLDRFVDLYRSIGDTPSSLLEDSVFEAEPGEDLIELPEDLEDLQKALRLLSFHAAVSEGEEEVDGQFHLPGSNSGSFGGFRSDGPVFVSGRFVLRQQIGRGSYGVVYRAYDMVAQREVALKVPRPELRGIRSVMRRFYREGTSIGKVVHPGLVPLLDMGQDGGTPFLVTRLVNGPNLEQWLDQTNGPLSFGLVGIWGLQLAEAVDHLHKRSIVHGDLKPSNILLEHPYEEESLELPPEMLALRVTDFGNASVVSDKVKSSGEKVQGTLCFMAPEQLAPEYRTDSRSDVYAICAVLYEMITGKPVFESTESRSLETAIRNSLPVPPQAIRHDTPFALQSIVMKGLSKRPDERYRNAGELARELTAWRNLRTPDVLRNHKHRQFALWVRRNRPVVFVITISCLIVSMLAIGRLYEGRINERLAQRRERNAWWSRYVDGIGVATRYLEMQSGPRVHEILDGLSQWPPDLGRKDDPREFAWHHLREMSRDRSQTVQGIPEGVVQVCLAADPRKNLVYSGGTDGHLRVIDCFSDSVVADHVIQETAIQTIALAPDGLTIAVSDPEGSIRFFDTDTFMILDTVRHHSDEITEMVFSPDSNFLISTSMDGFLAIFDTHDRSVSKTASTNTFDQEPRHAMHALAILPDGKRVAAAQSNDRIRIFDLASGELLRSLTGHFGEVHRLSISGNQEWMISTGTDRTLAFWDLRLQKLRNQVQVGSKFNFVKPAIGDGSKVRKVRAFATVTDSEGLEMVAVDVDAGKIKLFEIPSGNEVCQLTGDYGHVLSIAWSKPNQKIYASSSEGKILSWEAPFIEHSIHSDSFELGIGPDSMETVYFLDVVHQGTSRWRGGQSVKCVRYDQSCFRIDRTASASNGSIWGVVSKRVDQKRKEGFVEFRFAEAPGPDFPPGSEIEWKLVESHQVMLRRFAPSLQGHPDRPCFLVLDSDGRVTLIDLSDPKLPRTRSIVQDIDFATFRPDSDEILLIHEKGKKVSLWNYRTDTWTPVPVSSPDPMSSLVMASFAGLKDSVLLARLGGILEFRDIREGNLLKTIYLPEIGLRRVREVVFSRDFERMFVAMGFEDVFLIDIPSGKILQHWILKDREILKIALSRDSQSLWVLEALPDAAVADIDLHLERRRIRRYYAPGFHSASETAGSMAPAELFENALSGQK